MAKRNPEGGGRGRSSGKTQEDAPRARGGATRRRAAPSRKRPAGADQGAADYRSILAGSLENVDPALHRLARLEEERQARKLVLIASESLCPEPVRETLATAFGNLYAEGWPSRRMRGSREEDLLDLPEEFAFLRRYGDRRYYRGCDYADFVEALAARRAAELFETTRHPDAPVRVRAGDIHVNVQPLSGAAANNAVYEAVTKPGDVVMGMKLAEGGHLTHGSPVNRSGKHWSIVSYGIDPDSGRIDMDEVRRLALEHRPRMIIAGASAYPWHIDWRAFRSIADEVGAFLLADVAHYAGLIAAGAYPSPVGIAHFVTTTTHKTLCGPRGAIAMTTDPSLARRLDLAIFPGEQGGPHLHAIAAKAVAFRLARTDAFRTLMIQVVRNAKAMARATEREGCKVAYGGTECHLYLMDLRSLAATPGGEYPRGEIASRILDLCGITTNKNTIAGDRHALDPSGLRIGTCWITQRGFREDACEALAATIVRCIREIRPFRTTIGRAERGRGRVSLEVLERTQREVDALVEATTFPPRPPGAAEAPGFAYPVSSEPSRGRARAPSSHPPPPRGMPRGRAAMLYQRDAAGLLIRGERARGFVEHVFTANCRALGPRDGRAAALLDPEGRVLDAGQVFRLDDDPSGGPRYLWLGDPDREGRTARWLRALSDGYVLADPEDLAVKVDGPVAVEEFARAAGGVCHALLAGREAEARLVRLAGSVSIPPEGRLQSMHLAGVHALVSRTPRGFDPAGFHLLLPHDGRAVAAALFDGKVREAKRGQWPPSPLLPASEIHAACIDARKPFFVGRRALAAPAGAAGSKTLPREPAVEALEPRCSPLETLHLPAGANPVEAGGVKVPLDFGDVAAERRAATESAAVIDLSHLGLLEITGRDAEAFLDTVFSRAVSHQPPGRTRYGFLLNLSGEVEDDAVLVRPVPDRFLLVTNGENRAIVLAWLRAAAAGEVLVDEDREDTRLPDGVLIRDLGDPSAVSDHRVVLSVMGPGAREALEAALDRDVDREALATRGRSSCFEARWLSDDLIVSRFVWPGGASGYELFVHAEHAAALWNVLRAKGGKGDAVCAAGLTARREVRREAGLVRWGVDLAGPEAILPVEAGYGSRVELHKPFFVGRRAAAGAKRACSRELVRFAVAGDDGAGGSPGSAPVPPGTRVELEDGTAVGKVTSCGSVGSSHVGLALVRRGAVKVRTRLRLCLPQPREAQVLPRFARAAASSAGAKEKRR